MTYFRYASLILSWVLLIFSIHTGMHAHSFVAAVIIILLLLAIGGGDDNDFNLNYK